MDIHLLTVKAQKVLAEKPFWDKNLLFYEHLHHDGYDSEGPRSNLWELFLFDPTTQHVEWYHREDWFTSIEREYELEESGNISGKIVQIFPILADFFCLS